MIQRRSLAILSLLCVLSWAFLIGFLADGDSHGGAEVVVLAGQVWETAVEDGSLSITVLVDSQELTFALPAGCSIPEAGMMVALFCHASGSGLTLDSLQIL